MGALRDSIATVVEIIKNARLFVTYEPQLAISCMRVLNFDGEIIRVNGRKIPLVKSSQYRDNRSEGKRDRVQSRIKKNIRKPVAGDEFNSRQIRLVKRMKSGDKLHIQVVRLSCSSCAIRSKSIDLVIRIK